jgi:hypothetical protein
MICSARSLRGVLLASTVAVACTPSTFDNLSGGQEQSSGPTGSGVHEATNDKSTDPGIPPPRPTSPISVSWVNTSRPRFRWENPTGVTGAIVELSQTRDFKDPHTFKATGSELTLDADLPPGIWFWRLRGRTDSAEAPADPDKYSPVWELLVRGPSASGSSVAPGGQIIDADGDGEPDIVFNVEQTGQTPADPHQLLYYVVLGQPGHSFDVNNDQNLAVETLITANAAISGGADVDGDGFSDLAVTDVFPPAPEFGDPNSYGTMWIHYGGPGGESVEKTESETNGILTPPFTTAAVIQMAGDLNGDGYADATVSLVDQVFATLGGPKGLPTLEILASGDPKTTPAPLSGGYDLDGDGLSDVAISSSVPGSPVGYVLGSRDRVEDLTTLTLGFAPPPRAAAITMGDFDGKGAGQIAFTTVVSGNPGVCVYTPQSGALPADACWTKAGASVDGFGTSLAAGDLDADGTDEIVVASTTGIVVLKKGASGFVATDVPGEFLPSVTMIHPGRPDPARWAALGADTKSVTVFKGTQVSQVLPVGADPAVVRIGPLLR